MNDELTFQEVAELLPAYVLGALEPEEFLAVDNYLDQHRQLLKRIGELDEVTLQLAYASPPVPLPTDIKPRLMARVQADAEQQRQRERARMPVGQAASGKLLDSLRRWWSSIASANFKLGAALGALVLLTSGWAGINASQVNRLRADAEAMRVDIAALEQSNEALQAANGQLATQNQQLQEQHAAVQAQYALFANPVQTIVLPGTDAAPQAQATLYVGESQGALVLHGLEPLPDDQAYEFWLIPAEGDPIPAGLLSVTTAEPTVHTISLSDEDDFSAVGVSIEPAGGSPAPTGPIVLLGQLQ